jgi:membrane protein YqaA with SNARE-associated domain
MDAMQFGRLFAQCISAPAEVADAAMRALPIQQYMAIGEAIKHEHTAALGFALLAYTGRVTGAQVNHTLGYAATMALFSFVEQLRAE